MSQSLEDLKRLQDDAKHADLKYRRAIKRARDDGHSLREIAAVIGVTHQTVANLISGLDET